MTSLASPDAVTYEQAGYIYALRRFIRRTAKAEHPSPVTKKKP